MRDESARNTGHNSDAGNAPLEAGEWGTKSTAPEAASTPGRGDSEEREEPAAWHPELDTFAARALDWGEVRELYARFAPGPLGKRALYQLGPRRVDQARLALLRSGELISRGSSGERLPLAGIGDPMPFLETAKQFGRVLSEDNLCEVTSFLRGGALVWRWLSGRADELPECSQLAHQLPDLVVLRTALDEQLDERGRLKDDASARLSTLRQTSRKLEREVTRIVTAMANRSELRNHLAPGHAGRVQRRNGRPVLAVKARSRGRVPGIVHDRSQTAETLFVEPQAAVEPGNLLAENRVDEAHEVQRLLHELTRQIFTNMPAIERWSERLAEAELTVLGADFGLKFNARPARIPGDQGAGKGLVLRSMRHPLLLAALELGEIESVVPLDLRLGSEFNMLVITGPNTGGKTLALKSAGLAGLLTRLGLPVPFDEGSTVPFYDAVAADIGDEQEVSQSLSTFSSHLMRIKEGLARAGADTLFLLDELGGGTDPDEGAALGWALLEQLLRDNVPTIVSTHLGALKEFAFRHAAAENASVEFDVESLRPAYRLLLGIPGESRALAIARRLGLEPKILARAEERLERRLEEADLLIDDVRRSRTEAERLRGQAEDGLADVERKGRDLDQRRQLVEERSEQLASEAQRDLDLRLAGARPLLKRAQVLLAQVPRGARSELEGLLLSLDERLQGASLGEKRQAFLTGLKKGDLVYLPRYKKRLPVTRIWRDKSQITVRMGKLDVTVDFAEASPHEGI